jgi:hypothetical protein
MTAVLIALSIIAACWQIPVSGEESTPAVENPDGKNTTEVVLFDAENPEKCQVKNRTAAWKKDSDLLPASNVIDNDNGKWVEVSFSGERGKALTDYILAGTDQLASWREPCEGVRLLIDYDRDDYAKLSLHAGFADQTIIVKELTLEKGAREYLVTKGYRRANYPADWRTLKFLTLYATSEGGGNILRYRLKKIVAVPGKEEKALRGLRIENIRKAIEVLPLTGEITIDGAVGEDAWKNAVRLEDFSYLKAGTEITDSPFAARLTYDENKLYIFSQAEFPTPPLAAVTEPDGMVWQDEAREFFFSAENDNDKLIQFVSNANGVTFDYVREYDVTACRVLNVTAKTVEHDKKMKYENGFWAMEAAFPFSSLKADLTKRRFMGFQLAQDYINRQEPRLQTLSWIKTSKFPDPRFFGLLVFNRQPFGAGEVSVESVSRLLCGDNKADYSFKISCRGFAQKKYRLRLTLATADCTMLEQEQELDLSAGDLETTVSIPGCKSCNGTYGVYVEIVNENGDIRMASVNFSNDVEVADLFGAPVLFPKPKRVEWREGFFAARDCEKLYIANNATPRTRKTAEIFMERYYGFTGRHLDLRESENPAAETGVALLVTPEVEIGGKREVFRPEGYGLKVEPERVVITGCDEAGLFYGGVTFFQLLRHRMKIEDSRPVECVEIFDWPDLPNRLVNLQHPWGFPNNKFKEIRSIDYLKDWAERFVADQKLNVFRFDISELVIHKRRPEFSGSERIYSLHDLKELADFCRDRFIDLCPEWQIGGHANWWLLGYHPELREKGQNHQADITHPDHDPIVYDCMLDVIEAMRPKYLSPKGDEWWHGQKAGEAIEPVLHNGQTRPEAFLAWHVKFNDWLKTQGIRMMMFEDMLNPYHNGKRFDNYKIIDRFPKDIIITSWAGGDPDKAAEYFLSHGFEVWSTATGWWTFGEETRKKIKGAGKITYSFGPEIRLYDKDGAKNAHYSYAPFRIGDYAWNILNDPRHTVEDEIENGRLIAVRNICAVKPNPWASEKIKTFDFTQQMNCSLDKFLLAAKPELYGKAGEAVKFPSSLKEPGNIPTALSTEENNCLKINSDTAPVTIPLDSGKYSSLIFLHTAYVDAKYAKEQLLGNRAWIYGYPCGKYLVEYDDGEVRALNLRLGENIRQIDSNSLMRCTNDNRYIHAFKDALGNDLLLYQWEWVNPCPEKGVVKVTLAHDQVYDINLLLFALSGREVRRPE